MLSWRKRTRRGQTGPDSWMGYPVEPKLQNKAIVENNGCQSPLSEVQILPHKVVPYLRSSGSQQNTGGLVPADADPSSFPR